MNSFDVQQQNIDEFEKRLIKVIEQFKKRIKKALAGIPQANGKPIMSPATLKYATALMPQLLKDLDAAGFGSAVQKLMDSDAEIIKSLGTLTNIPIEFTQTAVQTIAALQSSQIASFSALSDRAVNTIREEVMRTVLTGATIEDALDVIYDSLDKQFKRYAYTYANTALRDTMQLSIDEGVRAAGLEEIYWEYTGPDDDVTRPACQEGLLIGFFSTEERDIFEAETADERAYNCRHAFVPVLKEEYERGKDMMEEVR